MSRASRTFLAFLLLGATPAFLACGSDDGGDDGGMGPDDTGSIQVTVNADGSPHSGVTVSLYAPGASTATATRTTGANGTATFADLDPGGREVGITVPSGFALDQGESPRKSVTVTAGQTATRSFAIVQQGGGGGGGGGGGTIIDVSVQDNLTFSPATVTISPGTTVRWTWTGGGMTHTVTPTGHSEWSSESATAQGHTFTHTFDQAGNFPYHCIPHQSQGMDGEVIVQ